MSGAHVIRCAAHPEPPNATWSNVLTVGREIHISGVHAHPLTRQAIDSGKPLDAYEQSMVIFDRIQALLESAGGGFHSIYKLVIYATTRDAKDGVNRARADRLGPQFPCSTFLVVNGFAFEGADVEIDVMANLDVDLRDNSAAAR